jgi:hypothetical protein
VAIGIAVGVPDALACRRFVASQLYGVPPNDLSTIAGAATILVVVALMASFLPGIPLLPSVRSNCLRRAGSGNPRDILDRRRPQSELSM